MFGAPRQRTKWNVGVVLRQAGPNPRCPIGQSPEEWSVLFHLSRLSSPFFSPCGQNIIVVPPANIPRQFPPPKQRITVAAQLLASCRQTINATVKRDVFTEIAGPSSVLGGGPADIQRLRWPGPNTVLARQSRSSPVNQTRPDSRAQPRPSPPSRCQY